MHLSSNPLWCHELCTSTSWSMCPPRPQQPAAAAFWMNPARTRFSPMPWSSAKRWPSRSIMARQARQGTRRRGVWRGVAKSRYEPDIKVLVLEILHLKPWFLWLKHVETMLKPWFQVCCISFREVVAGDAYARSWSPQSAVAFFSHRMGIVQQMVHWKPTKCPPPTLLLSQFIVLRLLVKNILVLLCLSRRSC